MKARLIALDIDGTILDRMAGVPVPDSVKEAVREAREDGARVCLCSSRPCYFMEDATAELGETDALIGCSGAEIYIGGIDGELFYRNGLSPSLIRACCEVAKRNDLYNSFSAPRRVLVSKKGLIGKDPGEGPFFSVMEEEEFLETLKAEIPLCGYIFGRPGVSDDVLTSEPAIAEATVNKASSQCFVVTSKGVDKGTGVLRLASLWGIPHEEILAVGNDENDIPMLKAAGTGVAVANACPAVLAIADWIAPDVLHGGAAEAIRRFALP